ncbi:MAG: HD domain-containing protein [Thermoproteota archaeon]
MVNGETIEAIRSEAIKHYAWDSSAHDQLHAERILRLSMRLLEKEGGDPEILAAAALLHDMSMKYEIAEDFDHAEKSAELAEQILLKIGFPKEKIPEVVDINQDSQV